MPMMKEQGFVLEMPSHLEENHILELSECCNFSLIGSKLNKDNNELKYNQTGSSK